VEQDQRVLSRTLQGKRWRRGARAMPLSPTHAGADPIFPTQSHPICPGHPVATPSPGAGCSKAP
jgi:hypothetical protein